jgi:hypothetical protein
MRGRTMADKPERSINFITSMNMLKVSESISKFTVILASSREISGESEVLVEQACAEFTKGMSHLSDAIDLLCKEELECAERKKMLIQ